MKRPASWKRYRYGNSPDLLPVDWEADPKITKAEIKAAGFDPNDSELGFGVLDEAWESHEAGCRVLSGLTCEGHPFAIETKTADSRAVRAAAQAEYDRVRAPAWAEYDRVRAAARAEFDRVCAAAQAEYDCVRAAAWAEYDRVRAAALLAGSAK